MTARDFANRINVGMFGINVPIPVPPAYHTFGGRKTSAFADLNQHGPDAARFCTRTRTITARWPWGLKRWREPELQTYGLKSKRAVAGPPFTICVTARSQTAARRRRRAARPPKAPRSRRPAAGTGTAATTPYNETWLMSWLLTFPLLLVLKNTVV